MIEALASDIVATAIVAKNVSPATGAMALSCSIAAKRDTAGATHHGNPNAIRQSTHCELGIIGQGEGIRKFGQWWLQLDMIFRTIRARKSAPQSCERQGYPCVGGSGADQIHQHLDRLGVTDNRRVRGRRRFSNKLCPVLVD